MGDPQVKRVTYELMNDVRDSSMSEVFGVKPNELVKVMRRLREQLFKRDADTEIVLMIEDFTLLQGVQHELLEAMLELPEREGTKVMCDLRAVIAVTKQRFSEIVTQNDTLRTRLSSQGHIYEIDLAYGSEEGELNDDQLMSFVGRYLNAVRLGASGLRPGQDGVDNACDSCRFRTECHEAFGADEDDYGLYPLNTEFLENLMQARRNEVNPRRLLQVMRSVLVDEADPLRSGGFPREEWAEASVASQTPPSRRQLTSISMCRTA